jgi:hypothetical protein
VIRLNSWIIISEVESNSSAGEFTMIVSLKLVISSTEAIDILASVSRKGECDNLCHEDERGRSNTFEMCECASKDELRMSLEVRNIQPFHFPTQAVTFQILFSSAHFPDHLWFLDSETKTFPDCILNSLY